MGKQRISSRSPLEPEIGFSRAVRAGPLICVAGTAAIAADGKADAVGNVYEQTLRCIEIGRMAIEEAGGTLDDVVRTRVMLVDIASWRDAAKAHGEVFGDSRPATTFVEVSRFIEPDWLVELEFDCFVLE